MGNGRDSLIVGGTKNGGTPNGDTITIKNGRQVWVSSINAPEFNGPGEEASKRCLQKLLTRGDSV